MKKVAGNIKVHANSSSSFNKDRITDTVGPRFNEPSTQRNSLYKAISFLNQSKPSKQKNDSKHRTLLLT